MIAWIATAAGLVLVIEGLFYAVVPGHLKALLLRMQDVGVDHLRLGGVAAMATGVTIVWLVRCFGG